MRPYELGDADLDARIRSLAVDADTGLRQDEATGLVEEMMVTALKLLRDDATRGDLKLINAALKEMRFDADNTLRSQAVHALSIAALTPGQRRESVLNFAPTASETAGP